MHGTATRYLIVESAGSGVVNGILNSAAAYLLFHGRGQIPIRGPVGLLRDTIGETFLVISLSFLVASLISRQRRRAGTLPVSDRGRPPSVRNLYLRSFVLGLIFTAVFVPCNAWLLPRMYPDGVTFHTVLWFKTLYGAVLGAIATCMATYIALNEAELANRPEQGK